jgi:Ca2+-binding RTX toxin-like protein
MTVSFHSVSGAYGAFLLKLVKGGEGTPFLTPQKTNDYTITFGYGYTFLRGKSFEYFENVDPDLAKIGITLTALQQSKLNQAARAKFDGKLSDYDKYVAEFLALWTTPPISLDNAYKLVEIDAENDAWGRMKDYARQAGAGALLPSLEGTYEKAALTDAAVVGIPKDVAISIFAALGQGDRAEAWFQLRYGWTEVAAQPHHWEGWAKRRYNQSAIFGLYDNWNSVRLDEATSALRMLQLHRDTIRVRESKYGYLLDNSGPGQRNMIDEGNTEYRSVLGDAGARIPTIFEAIKQAADVLIPEFQRTYGEALTGVNFADYLATNIYLDPNRDFAVDPVTKQAVALDPNHTAALVAVKYDSANVEYASKDILIGEGGNDYLVGGKGDDILLGGDGRDLYYYRMGDGNDRVIDADGGLLVIHADTYDLYVSGNFTKKADADEWTQAVTGSDRAVHTVTLSHGATWQMRLDDGAIIDLGQGDDLKRFGIQLNLGTLPDPGSPTLVGDPQIHFKAAVVQGSEPANWVVVRRSNEQPIKNESGEQTGVKYDAEYFLKDPATGNPTEPGGPTRDDTLAGTSNADFIQGLLGNDSIAGNAGSDRLEGGEGDDQLHGNDQDDTLLGGTGSDMLHGDAGKDRLFAQAAVPLDQPGIQGDYETAVAGRGDLLSGGADDDILIGAVADDLLAGGVGADLMYGRAGDDLLSGDVLVEHGQFELEL